MSLRTVKVPAAMEPLFAKAEQVVSSYFARRKDEPAKGTIEIFDERYLLVRAASLSVEFFGVVRDLLGVGREGEADEFSRNILFDLAHAMGKSDARNFHAKMGLDEPVARLSAGPVHFAHAGWAFVDISPRSTAVSGDDYYLLYDHPFSFESDAWLRAGKQSEFPVCIMNSGYSSGWCEESFGLRLIASEILCRARGDDCCRFIMAPPHRLEGHIHEYVTEARASGEQVGTHAIPNLFARKRLEDELREARDTLEQRVAERTEALRAANERLHQEIANRAHVEGMLAQSQKLEALGLLAGGIAHDFNNLLSAMGGYAELLQIELEPDSKAADFLSEIAASVSRAAGLTQQLLVFSRQRVAMPRIVDVSLLVGRLRNLLQRLIGEDVALVTRLAEGARIEADPTQIEQAIINLAVNARDAMPRGGTLTIAVDRRSPASGEQRVCLRVEDTGTGMDEVALQHIFDPFFTTKKPGEGTGLGLAMVYGTVTRYGGTIQVRSELGRGTRFEIDLPRVEGEPEADVVVPGPTSLSATPRRVLVVEDDLVVRGLLVHALKDAGHELLVASTGEEALRLWHANGGLIDLVVTDVIMPSMSGPTLIEQLRKFKPTLPVVYVSGYASDRVGDEAISNPHTVFLQKPFSFCSLLSHVDALLRN